MRLSGPQSLTARLVVTAVGLVALVSVLIGVTTTLAMRAYLDEQLDDRVRASVARELGGPVPDRDEGDRGPGARGDRGPDLDGPLGQSVGTLTATVGDTSGEGTVLVEQRAGPAEPHALSATALEVLADVPVDDRTHDVTVPGFGEFRVRAEPVTATDRLVVGLPLGDLDDTVTELARWQALLVALGLVAATVAGLVVVRRQLAPLREVAATADRVAQLPLASGEVEMSERVPDRLTDERTEVGRVGSALNAMLDHVEASLESRHRSEQQVRQFVADASHELRTPLATIAGYAELARRRPDSAPTALDKVEAESARMTSLVEDLLLLARLDAGRPLERQPVDLSLLLLEAVNDARVVDPARSWRVVLPEEPLTVTGDAARLHQVVTNLLINASKHTPPGTTVTVTGHSGGFIVKDDGPGFAAIVAPHAFERFTRGDAARNRAGGAGLGLSLVEAIVTAHGGTVSLSSAPGDTRVEVRLPRSHD